MAAKPAARPKETRAEKARRFQRMGSDMAIRDQRIKIETLLRNKPKIVPGVVEYLTSIGEWDETVEVDEESCTPPSKAKRNSGSGNEGGDEPPPKEAMSV